MCHKSNHNHQVPGKIILNATKSTLLFRTHNVANCQADYQIGQDTNLTTYLAFIDYLTDVGVYCKGSTHVKCDLYSLISLKTEFDITHAMWSTSQRRKNIQRVYSIERDIPQSFLIIQRDKLFSYLNHLLDKVRSRKARTYAFRTGFFI